MDTSLEQKITENLKFEIEHSGKKKQDIAAAIGVKPPTISEYLTGRAQPTLANLSRLCSFIGVSADDILEIKKD